MAKQRLDDFYFKVVIDGKEANVSLGQLSGALQQTEKTAKSSFDRIGDFSQKVFFIWEGFKRLAGPMKDMIRQANELEASNRKLAATSKLTGANLDELQKVANQSKTQFQLSTQQANEFTIQLTKLGQKAGDTSKTADAVGRLLDLAAAQGLDASQAMTAIQQAILGIDEGTDKLFQKNPSVIYAEYAKQIGTTAGRLNDQQKAQALLNAVMDDGMKVQGEYAKFLDSAAGKQALAATRAEELQAKLGTLINQIWVPMLELATPLIQFFTNLETGTQKMIIVTIAFAAAGWKLIPMFMAWNTSITVLGISLKTALGWIGLVITAITLLYTAWSNNFLGLRDATNTVWKYIKAFFLAFWDLIRDVGGRITTFITGIGNALMGLMKLDFQQMRQASVNVANAVVGDWANTSARLKAIWADALKDAPANAETRAYLSSNMRSSSSTATSTSRTSSSTDRRLADISIRGQYDGVPGPEMVQMQQASTDQLIELERLAADEKLRIQEQYWQDYQAQHRLGFATLEAGYDTFFGTILNKEMSAKEKREAIWESMKAAFIGTVGDMLKEYIFAQLKQTVVHQTETGKRVAVSLAAMAQEAAATLVSIGKTIGLMAAKLFAWFASKGPFGILLGLGAVPSLIAMVKGVISGLSKFAEGGIVNQATAALIGEGGSSEAVIPLDNRGAAFMANLIPKIAVNGGTGSVDFDAFANKVAQAIQDVNIRIEGVLSGQEFLRKEYPTYQRIEKERSF